MQNKKKKKKSSKKPVTFSESVRRKQFRLRDWLAEQVIKAMAFASIAIVALIFIFVFRETLPLFKGHLKTADNGTVTNELAPEVYSPGAEDQRPEVYSPYDEELKPEVYSPYQEELKPEVYSPEGEDNLQTETYPFPDSSATPGYIQQESGTGYENARARATLWTKDWQPVSSNPRYGLLPLIAGTLKVTLIAILFSAPIAILAALYTSTFAPKKIREYIKPAIELLAGFPSVVIGFFALMILASVFQDIFGYTNRLNALLGGFAMGLAAIPVIYTIAEDALTAVPRTYTEASLGLGASERQTAFMVILPAATPGIFAAVLLGIGRVFGETMIALMATGNAAIMTINPFDSVRTLSATIGAEMAEVVFGDTHYSVLFLIGSLLFVFTFILNALAEFYFKKRVMKRIQGK